jgi:glycosyltransferase involved in cell wall biosynthesis
MEPTVNQPTASQPTAMQLSVILPCYNGAETIAIQLEALAQQQWSGSWEVIVVNNGSTDESMNIVEQYRDRLPHLRILEAYTDRSRPRLGVVHSYNVAIQSTQSDAVAFCEADDEVAPGWVAAMGEGLAKYDIVGGRLDHKKLNPDWLYAANEAARDQEKGLTLLGWIPYSVITGCNLGMRRSLYKAVGELDESFPYCYDHEYCLKVQMAGFKLHFLPDALVHYRHRTSWKSSYRQGVSRGKDVLRIKEKHLKTPNSVGLRSRFWFLAKYLPNGARLLIMSIFNIRRGRGAFVLWLWGLGYQMGELEVVRNR